MEEEKIEVTQEQTQVNAKKFDFKKYLPYAGIALAVIILIIVLVTVLGGGPKKAVKNFVNGMNSKNAKKVIKSIDYIGMAAWGWQYDEDDFGEEDYNDFIDDYKEYSDKYEDKLEDGIDDMIDNFEDTFDDLEDEYKSYKMKIEKFKDVEKLGKDLYAVNAKVSIEAKPKDKEETDEIDESEVVTFIVYKNKLVSFGGIGF